MKIDTKVYEEKMSKSIASLEYEFGSLNAGRASAAALDRINVEFYGSSMPINQIAGIANPDPRTLIITPWDASALKEIEKAILASDLGINPQNDGKAIRLAFPQPTEERRKELAKKAEKLGEDSKVAIRNVRRDANDDIKKQKKDGLMTEDEQKAGEKSVQDITDRFIKLVDEITSKKEKEIMKI